MNTKNAVAERIIQLCNQKNIAINALANMNNKKRKPKQIVKK